ncbi:hypothetical protein KAR91_37040 [Candidatus Pacearchaeota archaeon]|nr:hypothetical protein [Candidatus Pacearchaeota archaeon]
MRVELDQKEEEAVRANIEFHGREFIEDLMVEEMGELLVAMKHFGRGRVPIEAVAEEIADVMIVAKQFARVIGEEKVDKFLDIKMGKLIKINILRKMLGEAIADSREAGI